jgi:opacity protein-like surface antigen
MGNFRSIIAALALVVSGTAGAAAADLGLPPPPPEPLPAPACCGGPWYLKGYLGMANPQVGNIFTSDFRTNDFTVYHHDIKSSPLAGVGIGYDTGHYLRFDITGEYRGSAAFFAQDKYPGSDGFNIVGPPFAPGAFNPGTNEYTADIKSWVGLANAYIDIGTWHCITPYVGGGVGFANISVVGLKDVNVPNNGVAFGVDHTQTNFAWGVYGGFAYDVTPSVTLDLSYRYTNLGDASSGPVKTYQGDLAYNSFKIKDITSQDVMLGMRWKFGCCGPAPMPFALK